MNWLHWIGNKHYSIAGFIKEAKKMGVSRRIPRHILKRMAWGDKVYLASRRPGTKNPVVFGYFYVESILGIKVDEIPEELRPKIQNIEGPAANMMLMQTRGCGSLVIGGFYVTSATVEELADYVNDPMVAGKGLKIFPRPWPMLRGMPPFRGFRPFDGKEFLEDLIATRDKPVMKHFYYA